uniref:Cilia-and flagella-associated protein 96 n=1 Tax=Laticauda laticaudata TaxID=8630 RepID=A0A8C5RAR4_LATLA
QIREGGGTMKVRITLGWKVNSPPVWRWLMRKRRNSCFQCLEDKIAYVQPEKNLYASPGKKGTGYGYPNLTIDKPYTHSVELSDIGRINFKKISEEHRYLMKGGPFKLNLYPREYFSTNPYHDEGPVPPPKRQLEKIPIPHPFKASSPTKKPGGMKTGTFDPFSTHSTDPYVFHPSPGTKSRPVRSIMALNIEKKKHILASLGFKTSRVQNLRSLGKPGFKC